MCVFKISDVQIYIYSRLFAFVTMLDKICKSVNSKYILKKKWFKTVFSTSFYPLFFRREKKKGKK